MKKLLTIALLLFVSCTQIKTVTKTEHTTDTVYIPKTITIELPSDTVKIESPIYVDMVKDSVLMDTVYVYRTIPLARMDTIIKEKGLVGAMAWITANKLFLEAYIADSTLIYENDSLQQVITDKYTTETTTTKEVRKSGRPSSLFWFMIGMFTAFTLVLLLKKYL